MGVAGLIPRNFPNPSAEDWQDLFGNLSETGELLGVYTNWTDSPETAGQIPQAVETAFGLAEQYGFVPLIALGFHRDSPNGLEPTISWTDAAQRGNFQQVAIAIAERYRPPYVALGVEVNRFYEYNPAEFEAFVAAYEEIYEAIKAVSPDTLVFPIFQLEMTKGGGYLLGGSETREPQWELLSRFGDRLDLAVFTTYSYLDYPLPSDLPANYYSEIAAYTTHPVAFTEIGWPSAPFANAPDSEYGGNEEEQAEFVRRFFELTSDLDMALAVWSFPHDLGADSNPAFTSVSLRHNDGTPKPSLAEWRSFVRGSP